MKRNLFAGAVLAVASVLATSGHAARRDAGAAGVAAGKDDARSVDVFLTAEVEIAADGRVRTLAWQVPERKPLVGLLTQRLEPAVRGWKFQPGTLDGAPADTRTYLSIKTRGTPDSAGGLAFVIVRASTGARSLLLTPPRYPTGAAVGGISATVVTEVDVDAQGKVAFQTVQFVNNRGSDRYRREFIAATEKAVAAWTFTPERVGGHAVAARMRIPVTFCAPEDGGWCEQHSTLEDDALAGPAGQPVALDSAVKLLTPVVGNAI